MLACRVFQRQSDGRNKKRLRLLRQTRHALTEVAGDLPRQTAIGQSDLTPKYPQPPTVDGNRRERLDQRVVLRDARIEPAQPRQFRGIVVAVCDRVVGRHGDRQRHGLRRHAVGAYGQLAAIHARLGIGGNIQPHPQRLHPFFADIHARRERLAGVVDTAQVETSQRGGGKDRAVRAVQIGQRYFHVADRLVRRPQADLKTQVFAALRRIGQ